MFDEMRAAVTAARARERRPDALSASETLESRPSACCGPRPGRRRRLARARQTGRSGRRQPRGLAVRAVGGSGGGRRHGRVRIEGTADARRRGGTLRGGDLSMARSCDKEESRPGQSCSAGEPDQKKSRRKAEKTLEDELFFTRLRGHAKWAFALLAIVFAGSFVFLGVGARETPGSATSLATSSAAVELLPSRSCRSASPSGRGTRPPSRIWPRRSARRSERGRDRRLPRLPRHQP